MSNPKFDPVMIKVDQLHEFPGNPNEQDPVTFNNLVEEIERDGWDEPVIVVPRDKIEPGKPGYTVVSGNHRLKAAQVLDYAEIPCVVKSDWDDEQSKIKVIRRNNIRGENNPAKFAKLIDSFENKYTPDQLADMMGFKDLADFEKLYDKEQEDQDNKAKEGVADAKEEINLIDGLSLILNRLFAEYGDTVPFSFLFFLYGSKIHLVVQTNTKLRKLLEMITTRCVKDGLDVNLVLTGLLGLGVKATNFEAGPPERAAIENEATDGADEEYEMSAVTRGS